MKYLIPVTLAFSLMFGLSSSTTETKSANDSSTLQCPYTGKDSGGRDAATTGCPYLDRTSGCPYQESTITGSTRCPYSGQKSGSERCPYLEKKIDGTGKTSIQETEKRA